MNKKLGITFLVLICVLALSGTALAYFMGSNSGSAGIPNGGAVNCGYGNGYGGYGMMGGYGSSSNIAVKDDKTAESDMDASLANAKVDKDSNTITYTGKDVKIVMFAGPETADDKFVIGGLVNPTLKIPQGANVTMEMINEDKGMPHGVEITSAVPPYTSMPMMQGWVYPGAFIHPISQAASNGYPVTQASLVADQAGTYYYICQYPGHAAEGMYGQIIIEKI